MASKQVGITLEDAGLCEALQFDAYYSLETKLRSGSYGTVYITKHKESGGEFAVKVIDRRCVFLRLDFLITYDFSYQLMTISNFISHCVALSFSKLKKSVDDSAVFREVDVLKELRDVQGIVSLIDFFVKPDVFHIVQVLARGGDVFDRLAKRTTYSEKDARKLAKQLLETMRDMHERRFIHRDLKPENLLLKHEDIDSNILLADFGFSKKIPKEGLKTRCGTPAFVAPEILVGSQYDESVDMWSVGVLLFLLIGGYPPFQDENHRGLFRKIRAADYIFHETYWEHVSADAKVLISSLMCVNPEYRWTAVQALNCNWIETHDEFLSTRSLKKALEELRKFNARRKLKSAIRAVHWATSATFWKPDFITFSQQQVTWDKEEAAVTQRN
jgi:calcium/calmodulin-dependent protein kinase I